jgi:hypothetical protein
MAVRAVSRRQGVGRPSSYDPPVAEVERAGERTRGRRSWSRAARGIAILAIALATVAAASIYVGFVGSPDTRFSWELAAVFGTALGTTLLALSTGALAWSTRSEVRATQDLAELTREQQAANERPVVLQESVGWSGMPESGTLTIVLRNVGIGPALRVRVSPRYDGHTDWQPGLPDRVTIPAILAGESYDFDVAANFPDVPHEPPASVYSGAFDITGDYLDRSMLNEYPIITI